RLHLLEDYVQPQQSNFLGQDKVLCADDLNSNIHFLCFSDHYFLSMSLSLPSALRYLKLCRMNFSMSHLFSYLIITTVIIIFFTVIIVIAILVVIIPFFSWCFIIFFLVVFCVWVCLLVRMLLFVGVSLYISMFFFCLFLS